jgi:hypothetical protein
MDGDTAGTGITGAWAMNSSMILAMDSMPYLSQINYLSIAHAADPT